MVMDVSKLTSYYGESGTYLTRWTLLPRAYWGGTTAACNTTANPYGDMSILSCHRPLLSFAGSGFHSCFHQRVKSVNVFS